MCITVILGVRKLATTNFFVRAVLRALKLGGDVPHHVAFIMDGNRRWARKSNLEVCSGHERGGEKLTESLQWCLEAGVTCVTVYAFSIENYKRSPSEVGAIMGLCELKFREMLLHSDVIQRHRVRVRVLGDLTQICAPLRELMNTLMHSTRDYDGPTLNMCFSYAGRYDMASAISHLYGYGLHSDEITADSISAFLSTGYANGCSTETSYPELIIRTSGETRLSDFLLWESAFSRIAFCDALWPDLSAWDFVKLILDYQTEKRSININSNNKQQDFPIEDGKWKPENVSHETRSAILQHRQRYFADIQDNLEAQKSTN